MRKLASPGFFWATLLLVILATIAIKYRARAMFELDIAYTLLLAIFIACTIYTYYFDMGKSRLMPMASFLFGLFFWIPLLNLLFGVPALYFGIMALKKINHNPTKCGGKWFAVIGIILAAVVYTTFLIGISMCIFGYKEICGNIGLGFLAG